MLPHRVPFILALLIGDKLLTLDNVINMPNNLSQFVNITIVMRKTPVTCLINLKHLCALSIRLRYVLHVCAQKR